MIWWFAIPMAGQIAAILLSFCAYLILGEVHTNAGFSPADRPLFTGVGAIIGLLWGYLYFKRIDNRRKRKGAERWAFEKPAWDAAIAKWRRLHFCHRDGIVFDTEANQTCEPQRLSQFVYTHP